MPNPTQQLMARLRRIARPRDESDGVALTRFARHRDPEAFDRLVRRFGPMVLGVCRRVLGPTPDADDAYQAAFLVLVRKAGTIRPPEAVGSWLFAVAHRTAVYARTAMRRRSAKLRQLDHEPATAPPDSSDLLSALDAELAQLPDKFRDAVVLCELHGRSLKEAAGSLGVPVGTLASRLARGRQMLADRLKSQGFVLTAAGVSGLLASAGASASGFLPPTVDATAGSAQLADGVMKMALLSKLKLTTAAALAALAVGGFALGLLPGPAAMPVARAAPVPKGDGKLTEAKVKELDELWYQLLIYYKPEAAQAALRFVAQPGPTVTYLKEKLKPLKMDEDEAKALIAKLFSDKEEEAKAAETELIHRRPILAMKVPDIWAEAKTPEHKSRLAAVLMGHRWEEHDKLNFELAEQKGAAGQVHPFVMLMAKKPGAQMAGGQFGPGVKQVSTGIADAVTKLNGHNWCEWNRDHTAVLVLEGVGTPEAIKLIEDMATGHPDAKPTQTAKEALARLKKK